MEYFAMFLTAALTALALENAVFFRVLGLNRHAVFLKSPKSGILYGGVFTAAAVLIALPVALMNFLLGENPYMSFIRAPLYFISAAGIYILMHFASEKVFPKHYQAIRVLLPVSIFNTAMFGAFFAGAMGSFNVFQTLGYALGGGIGYTAAIQVVCYAGKSLALSAIPRSFRGLPILLLYIGILSMAFYGIVGTGLPS